MERIAKELSSQLKDAAMESAVDGEREERNYQTAVNGHLDNGRGETNMMVKLRQCPQQCQRLCVRVQIEPVPKQYNQNQTHTTQLFAEDPRRIENGTPSNFESTNTNSNGVYHHNERMFTPETQRGPVEDLPVVSSVPRLPLIFNSNPTDRASPRPVKDIHKVRRHLDQIGERRDEIFVMDGD